MGPEIALTPEALASLAMAVGLLADVATIVQFAHWLWTEYKHRRDGERE